MSSLYLKYSISIADFSLLFVFKSKRVAEPRVKIIVKAILLSNPSVTLPLIIRPLPYTVSSIDAIGLNPHAPIPSRFAHKIPQVAFVKIAPQMFPRLKTSVPRRKLKRNVFIKKTKSSVYEKLIIAKTKEVKITAEIGLISLASIVVIKP